MLLFSRVTPRRELAAAPRMARREVAVALPTARRARFFALRSLFRAVRFRALRFTPRLAALNSPVNSFFALFACETIVPSVEPIASATFVSTSDFASVIASLLVASEPAHFNRRTETHAS